MGSVLLEDGLITTKRRSEAKEDEAVLRLHRCAFTGHRPEKINVTEHRLAKVLREAIEDAIDDGFTTFISGLSRGVDLIAAEIVLDMRRAEDIELIAASPYNGFEERWGAEWKKRYQRFIEQADLIKYISPGYFPSCIQARNEWMINKSSRLIAAYNGSAGGTQNTIAYAEKCDVNVRIIFC